MVKQIIFMIRIFKVIYMNIKVIIDNLNIECIYDYGHVSIKIHLQSNDIVNCSIINSFIIALYKCSIGPFILI